MAIRSSGDCEDRCVKVFIVCACLVGCTTSRPVTILSPESGGTVTDHAPMDLTVQVEQGPIANLELLVDGDVAPMTVTPEPSATDCTTCMFTITWSGREAGEGTQQITVREPDDGTDSIELVFDDVPEITSETPVGGDLRGVTAANVGVTVIERGATTARVEIDGVPHGSAVSGESCRAGCVLGGPWDTAALPAGEHDLGIFIDDDDGNHVEMHRKLVVDDVIRVRGIQVTQESDFGALELEVHLFDTVAQKYLGCARLTDADYSDRHYDVEAKLVQADGTTGVGSTDIGSHTVQLYVTEDDAGAQCPEPALGGDDSLGGSPAMTFDQLRAQTAPMTFGTVTSLTIDVGRPYQL